ncbi:MAG: hypothetical protein ACXW3A_18035, partial [Allosphingosinicella sp.]
SVVFEFACKLFRELRSLRKVSIAIAIAYLLSLWGIEIVGDQDVYLQRENALLFCQMASIWGLVQMLRASFTLSLALSTPPTFGRPALEDRPDDMQRQRGEAQQPADEAAGDAAGFGQPPPQRYLLSSSSRFHRCASSGTVT